MRKQKPEHISQADWDAVDSPPLDSSFLATMRPAAEHPDFPPQVKKTPISIRLDESVVSSFRATGRGWQSRVNQILRDWLQEHGSAS
jgi:uncharacterized protein (DUF4415 family)